MIFELLFSELWSRLPREPFGLISSKPRQQQVDMMDRRVGILNGNSRGNRVIRRITIRKMGPEVSCSTGYTHLTYVREDTYIVVWEVIGQHVHDQRLIRQTRSAKR